ncbi:MAG TPA: hypothetical protein VJN18_27130 [Polyangiaceae bacterium]|nr:hypothetical protein [Polyangiaceae bacterium]
MKWPSPLPSACLVAVAVAIPTGFQWGAESPTWTDPAGTTGASAVESLIPTEFFGLQALKLWDFDGRTCSMQLEQSSFNAPNPRPLDPVRFCEPKQTQSWKRADIGSGQFVTGISVCTAKAPGPQIHGVELWGASIEGNGKLEPAKAPVRLELPSCEKWSPKRVCPAGTLATGMRAHLGESNLGAVGLALRCQAIKAAN